MPVLPNLDLTHQWLRELKRRGGTFQRTMVGVTFRLSSDEPVWVGHFGRDMAHLALGQAIRLILEQEDARGYQILVPRPINSNEVHGVRRLPQVVGWRYMPNAHGRPPCACPACLPKGEYRSASIRARLEPEPKPLGKPALLALLTAAESDEEIVRVLWQLAARRRGGGKELAFLVDSPSARVRVALAMALGAYRGPVARKLLRQLGDDPDDAVRLEAEESLSGSAGS
jgi:hypothetical protein